MMVLREICMEHFIMALLWNIHIQVNFKKNYYKKRKGIEECKILVPKQDEHS